MKNCLVAVGLLVCASGLVLAGPNAGGVLVAHDANLLASQTDGSVSVCGQGTVPAGHSDIDAEIDGSVAENPSVFKIYAVFPDGSAPRLMGITWGITYDPDVVLGAWGMCGNFELNDPTWPQSGTGSSVTWPDPQMGLLTPVYWFMGYNYYGNPQIFQLGPNPSPTLGGYFGDDAIPAHLDPIACFGTLGFDQPGWPCPYVSPPGACCDPATGACTITLPDDCAPPFVFHPETMTCDPNPCPFPHQGACCPCNYCYITTPEDCEAHNGTYIGDGTTCDPSPCVWPPIGACCVNYVCTIEYVWDCEQMGGAYYGDCSLCEPTPCPPPTPIEESSWGRIKARFR